MGLDGGVLEGDRQRAELQAGGQALGRGLGEVAADLGLAVGDQRRPSWAPRCTWPSSTIANCLLGADQGSCGRSRRTSWCPSPSKLEADHVVDLRSAGCRRWPTSSSVPSIIGGGEQVLGRRRGLRATAGRLGRAAGDERLVGVVHRRWPGVPSLSGSVNASKASIASWLSSVVHLRGRPRARTLVERLGDRGGPRLFAGHLGRGARLGGGPSAVAGRARSPLGVGLVGAAGVGGGRRWRVAWARRTARGRRCRRSSAAHGCAVAAGARRVAVTPAPGRRLPAPAAGRAAVGSWGVARRRRRRRGSKSVQATMRKRSCAWRLTTSTRSSAASWPGISTTIWFCHPGWDLTSASETPLPLTRWSMIWLGLVEAVGWTDHRRRSGGCWCRPGGPGRARASRCP